LKKQILAYHEQIIPGLKEVEKYRVDENCKPCPIYKTEVKTKSTDEFFKFLSIIK
jgi:hypothetical protein